MKKIEFLNELGELLDKYKYRIENSHFHQDGELLDSFGIVNTENNEVECILCDTDITPNILWETAHDIQQGLL